MIGARHRFGRSCLAPFSAVIALLFGFSSSPAQRVDPMSPLPEMNGAPRGGCHGGALRELYAVPGGDSTAPSPKLAADPDTAVIIPGSRDFLEPNVPNPFGDVVRRTDIAYSLAVESAVELRIYDFFYNEVATLVDGAVQPAGRHIIPFDPPPTMPSGMYFCELKTPRYRELRRMIYIK